ncbi:SDR family oxidoreductase [Sphingobacterium sp. SGG-5]|uniref:SDR family NAD(P)-dependent oxidoreductase n=1 Tax=Sphingobacterium sp. SGG-5 TaxID=2710881 RepID=UPI0013ED50DB|nr:SDR family oxidoreductase [Sphingobacterium sp. SGG-5]NGM62836.1 SDR family oxidoreductase [Sphingobacterium sp. SGG-5]
MTAHKVAIVTGATRGIGRSTAIGLARKGYHVALVGRDKNELMALKQWIEKDGDTHAIVCAGDLSDTHFWDEIIESTLSIWNCIDLLVNNAAWRTIEPMSDIDITNWDKTIRICLTAPAFLAKKVCQSMLEKGISGVVINVSSVMSQRTGGYSPAYAACKGGMESLTYELATLYGPANIRVVCVNPGNVQTDMGQDYEDQQGNNVSAQIGADMNDHTPLKRAASSEEIAQAITWLSSKEASFITGTTLVVDGGFTHNFNSYSMKKLQFPHLF